MFSRRKKIAALRRAFGARRIRRVALPVTRRRRSASALVRWEKTTTADRVRPRRRARAARRAPRQYTARDRPRLSSAKRANALSVVTRLPCAPRPPHHRRVRVDNVSALYADPTAGAPRRRVSRSLYRRHVRHAIAATRSHSSSRRSSVAAAPVVPRSRDRRATVFIGRSERVYALTRSVVRRRPSVRTRACCVCVCV